MNDKNALHTAQICSHNQWKTTILKVFGMKYGKYTDIFGIVSQRKYIESEEEDHWILSFQYETFSEIEPFFDSKKELQLVLNFQK